MLQHAPRQRAMDAPRQRIAGVIAPVRPRLCQPVPERGQRLWPGRVDLAPKRLADLPERRRMVSREKRRNRRNERIASASGLRRVVVRLH